MLNPEPSTIMWFLPCGFQVAKSSPSMQVVFFSPLPVGTILDVTPQVSLKRCTVFYTTVKVSPESTRGTLLLTCTMWDDLRNHIQHTSFPPQHGCRIALSCLVAPPNRA